MYFNITVAVMKIRMLYAKLPVNQIANLTNEASLITLT